MKALIDADYLRYNIGFSGETSYYVVVDMEEDDKEVVRFQYKRDLTAWLEENDKPSYTVVKEKEVADLGWVLGRCKTKIMEILHATKADDYQLWLTGPNNFRETLVDYYKGNRDPNHKPVHFEAIGEYLVRQWGAEYTDGIEADDALGLAQQESGTVICTIDKDLDGVPGLHYWSTVGLYSLSEEDALHFFYKQLLTGDTTDNITGVPGVGPVKADKLLDACHTEAEYLDTIYSAYVSKYPTRGFEMMDENACLLWIQRQGRIHWTDNEEVQEWMSKIL